MGSRAQVSEALGPIEAVLDAVGKHYLGKRQPEKLGRPAYWAAFVL